MQSSHTAVIVKTDPWAALDDDIEFTGTKFVLPEGMTLDQAINALEEKSEGYESVTEFSREFPFRPYDGALAAIEVLYAMFGVVDGKPIQNWFGEEPPEMRKIETGFNEVRDVPWGHFGVPQLDRTTIGFHERTDKGTGAPVFFMHVYAPRKYKKVLELVFDSIGDRLKEYSIYRGKAFYVNEGNEITFLDLTGVNRDEVVYSDLVQQQLQADVWSLLEHSDMMRLHNISLRRAVVLNGNYGTGKTLAGNLTAQIAVNNGWTFIYCRPGAKVEDAMVMAAQYSPAVVFIEDVDAVVEQDGDLTRLSQTLEIFDGFKSKGVEVITISTTNRIDVLPKAMLRPGRLDSIIDIGPLEQKGVERLVRVSIPSESLAENIDWDAVFRAMDGFTPAFVREVAGRAARYGFVRTNSFADLVVTTEDILVAAQSMRRQHEMMESAEEMGSRPSLEVAFGELVGRAVSNEVHGTKMYLDGRPSGYQLVPASANGSWPS